MHKVYNYGSALQAWATLKIVEKLGHQAELIDYLYPNSYHKKSYKKNIIKASFQRVLHFFQGNPQEKKKRAFHLFWKENYKMSSMYESYDDIHKEFPEYDIYIVGSDQVWNLQYINFDTTFFLDFVKGRKCISYASSLIIENDKVNDFLLSNLSRFKALSVRENSGKNYLINMLGREIAVTLDPTLLLSREDYLQLSQLSTIKIPSKPYILVYILKYAYNPYPYASRFIENIVAQTGWDVICIDFSVTQRLHEVKCKNLRDSIGPCDFVSLFMNASFVITTSFHGTAFAINFGIPFYSIVNNEKDFKDDRMVSLANQVSLQDRCIKVGQPFPSVNLSFPNGAKNKLDLLRKESINYLKENLQ